MIAKNTLQHEYEDTQFRWVFDNHDKQIINDSSHEQICATVCRYPCNLLSFPIYEIEINK